MYKALLNCEPELRSESDVRLIVSMLKNVKFLKTVPPELQVEVCRVIRLRPYRARGLKIIKQGDVGQRFFILLSGAASVYVSNPDSGKTADTDLGYGFPAAGCDAQPALHHVTCCMQVSCGENLCWGCVRRASVDQRRRHCAKGNRGHR